MHRSPSMTEIGQIRVMALFCAGLLVAYAGVWSYGFVYEDYRALQAGVLPFVLGPRGLSSWLWWRDPVASHLLSLGLHVVVGGLTWLLGRRLGLSRQAAVLAAGVLLLHPMAVETSVYLSSRTELIAAIGILLACLCATGPRWAWLLILPAIALGVLGKESAIVGLGLVPLVWAYRRPTWCTWALVGVGALAWIPLGVYRLGSLAALVHADDVTSGLGGAWWAVMQSTAVFRLAVLSVVSWLPVGHTIDFDYDAIPLLSRVAAFVLLGLVSLVLWLYRARVPQLVLFACAACLIALVPRMVIQTPRAYLSEHQFYVPLIFVVIAAAACWDVWRQTVWLFNFGLTRSWSSRRGANIVTPLWLHRRDIVTVGLLLCLTWQTRAAVQVWQSDYTLWQYAYFMAPTKPRPAANYAVALLVQGERRAGAAVLDHAAVLAQAPHVTPWDRREALEMVEINRRVLRDMDAQAYLRNEAALATFSPPPHASMHAPTP